jgi:hypothetical protein
VEGIIQNVKTLLTALSAIFLFANASFATIDGFIYKDGNGSAAYTVPAGKILVLQQVSFNPTEAAGNHFLNINNTAVFFPSATNGLYTLPKALFLPAGTAVSSPNTLFIVVFGVIIDASDAPLFAGGGSSLGNVAIAGDTLTGVLQLSSTAPSTVLILSSTNLVDWSYDSTVMVQPGADKTKMRFTVPLSGADHFYRALVRRANTG